ncbi:MAG: hypothetical protein HUU35_17280 [Armatimonadetes bacterium]|nr:hypothetical protein [Armatimonadota bacterium]
MGTLLAMLCLITVNGRDLTYQIDYGGGILRPDYAEALRACPPDLLHVGIEGAPLPSYWFGTQAQPAPDPRGVRRRLETFRTLVASLHEVGVRTVMPYLCAITIGGDPEPPLGWFGFFQRWDEYAEFGLGPKPATGPLEWLQRRPDGQPMLYYAFDHYRPLHRYAVAPTNPHWQHFLATVARLMAEAGYDGVFVDNPNARDFGPDAQRALAAWAAALPAAERAAAWPAGPPTMAADGQSPAATLTRRFMAESEARLLAVIREGGVGGGRPAFQVNPNAAGWAARLYGHGHDLRAMAPAIALAMDEGATWPGVEQQGFAGLLTRQFARDNLFSYLRGQIPGRDPINCLATRGKMVSDAQLLLASAGAAAFGGLWVHRRLDDPRLDGWEQFAGFARAHRDLFEQLEPAAEVAVAWSTPDLLAGFTDHFGACEETARFLLREQIPLRLIELSDSSPAALRGYRVVVLPQVRCFDPAGLDLLQRYVEGGGTIVAIGPTATHDPLARASLTPGLATAPRIRNFATWPTSAAAWLAVRQALGAALPHGGSLVVEHDVPGLRLAH